MKAKQNWDDRQSLISDTDLKRLVKAYLEEGLSYRELERRLLGIDSPDRGGGFRAKTALDEVGVFFKPKNEIGQQVGIILKGVLRKMTVGDLYVAAKKKGLKELQTTLEIVYGV